MLRGKKVFKSFLHVDMGLHDLRNRKIFAGSVGVCPGVCMCVIVHRDRTCVEKTALDLVKYKYSFYTSGKVRGQDNESFSKQVKAGDSFFLFQK